ncbi:hypothetical protein HNP84_009534 [Thermocatellispora tengchongensis]|uniref:DNA-binding protein n=1 Tax=Thermocatellispora tengchongensis TaxID=1073253 RepID=A0A840PPV7_9ACTN|nr:OB-fold domain-containing protein [Thermocatellispora tengchongensis]MBB5139770.1 hypothetical protein [Thermocatellispora tengchongensis]
MSGPGKVADLRRAGLAPHLEYTERLAEGAVPFQSCEECRAAVFPPRVLCPACGAMELTWERSAGLGTVYSTSVLFPRGRDPYPVVLVDLDEGFRMMSTVTGTPAEEVAIGARVRAHVDPAGPDGPHVAFTLETGERDERP